MRKFSVIKKYEDKGINLPTRGTEHSAGYDIECAEDVTIPSIWSSDTKKGTLVSTGIKVYMGNNEYVALVGRSSNFNKLGLMLANNFAVIDSDYVDNEENEGHIYLNLINFGIKPVVIKKGQKVAQAIFHKFEKTDNDEICCGSKIRTGGFGSTGI